MLANKKMQGPLNNWSFKFIVFPCEMSNLLAFHRVLRHLAMAGDLHWCSASFFGSQLLGKKGILYTSSESTIL